MIEEEINHIIAEFMEYGWDYENGEYYDLDSGAPITDFTESLDSLVPVWEKLEKQCPDFDTIRILPCSKTFDYIFWFHNFWEGEIRYHTEAETIQLAAAMATAKAIMELDK